MADTKDLKAQIAAQEAANKKTKADIAKMDAKRAQKKRAAEVTAKLRAKRKADVASATKKATAPKSVTPTSRVRGSSSGMLGQTTDAIKKRKKMLDSV